VAGLQNDLAGYRATELADGAATRQLRDGTPVRVVARSVDGDAAALKALAVAIASRPGFVVVLVSASSPALVVVARSGDVAGVSAQAVLAALLKQFGGRGGGKAELAQGGGLTGAADEILALSATVL